MTYRGGATLDWQSDYCQFYVADTADPMFEAPVEITPEMAVRNWSTMIPCGLVVYTNDCLKQLIDIQIFGAQPVAEATDWRSGKAWTQVELAHAEFPSKQFTISSPSSPGGTYGPIFRVDESAMIVRISWMQFQGTRDDSGLVEPDVISLQLWPR